MSILLQVTGEIISNVRSDKDPLSRGTLVDDHVQISDFSSHELIRREQLFPPQAQCLLRSAVRETEQHCLSLRSMSYRIPRRHDENIMRLPDKRSSPNLRTSPAFDDAINRRDRRPLGQALISSRQQLQKGRDRRHRISTGHWIAVLHLNAVVAINRAVPPQFL